jgi:hypothetical protein
MRKPFFTFSFRGFASPLIVTITIIATIELLLSMDALSGHFHWLNVDQMVSAIDHDKDDPPYLVIGDSVLGSTGRSLTGKKFATYATNQGIEMVGQYFVVRRYFDWGKRPKAVIFIGLNPLGKNLKSPWAEDYVRRVFLRFSEIWNIFVVGRSPRFSAGMLIYKFFPTYRSREVIRSWIGYEPRKDAPSERQASGQENSILFFLGRWIFPENERDLSKIYFDELLNFLAARQVDFYFIHPGISRSNYGLWWQTSEFKPGPFMPSSGRELENYLSSAAKTHPLFHYAGLKFPVYPDEYFDDQIHFRSEKGPIYMKDLETQLSEILPDR